MVARLDPIFRWLSPGMGEDCADAGARAAQRDGRAGLSALRPSGAGHFVKMVHNGIEYGMMAAYAEGLNILRHANEGKHATALDAETTPMRNPEFYQYELNLPDVAEVWRRGSVISSWLLDLAAQALIDSPDLAKFAGHVSDSGEGRWTIRAAIDEAVPVPVLSAALYERSVARRGRLCGQDAVGAALPVWRALEKTGDEKGSA